MTDTTPALNTDRELWRERDDDYYANSIHVTLGGSICINVGGTVFCKPLAEWHSLAALSTRPSSALAARMGQYTRVYGVLTADDRAFFATVVEALSRPSDAPAPSADTLHFVFDGPPGPEAGRFVECETPDGRSVNAGEWRERADGYWELIVALSRPSADFAAGVEAARPLFSFKRYVNGVEMADGICIEKESTLDRAINRAVALCPARHGVTVLVLGAIPTPAPAPTAGEGGLRKALEPVMHWYQSDEHEDRPLLDIVSDVVADLQQDRTDALALRKALSRICMEAIKAPDEMSLAAPGAYWRTLAINYRTIARAALTQDAE